MEEAGERIDCISVTSPESEGRCSLDFHVSTYNSCMCAVLRYGQSVVAAFRPLICATDCKGCGCLRASDALYLTLCDPPHVMFDSMANCMLYARLSQCELYFMSTYRWL